MIYLKFWLACMLAPPPPHELIKFICRAPFLFHFSLGSCHVCFLSNTSFRAEIKKVCSVKANKDLQTIEEITGELEMVLKFSVGISQDRQQQVLALAPEQQVHTLAAEPVPVGLTFFLRWPAGTHISVHACLSTGYCVCLHA